jgi:hypothetical protein
MWKEYEAARYRRVESLEEAKRWRLTQLVWQVPRRPSLRARVARRLVDTAFALETYKT